MKCAYKMRAGVSIAVDGRIVTSKGFLQNETFTMTDILAIRYVEPTTWKNGFFEILTRETFLKQKAANVKKYAPHTYTFVAKDATIYEPFFQEFLSEIRRYKGSQGVLKDGWWTWPEDEASGSAEQNNVLAEALPADAPAPAAPTEPAAAPVEAAVERAIQSSVTGEQQKKVPACPDCGCTSIFADKDDGGVIITCLNCGRQWRPGEHRSW